ncbi:hypothetical protein ZWY2020_002857 [Hordeum vulgare]|nr:hypothetical protein ZWY2020_002857 [Hordeum vulgare]
MGMHEERHGKGVVVSEFPSGLRVLAIDNDPVNLKVLEILLRMRNYHLTIARDAMTALRMLREGGRGNFDLVISDVYMSNMDGFKLLKLIDLEMDLPVIVLSANERPEAIVKAIAYGACGYLVKPVQTNDLNIMWRQVISRRTPDPWSFCSSIGNAAAEKAQPTGGAAGGEQGGAESTKYGWAKSHEHDGDDHDANKENMSPDRSTGKRLRTTWTSELHDKFVKAVSQIGINRAVPSKILAKMNVDNNVSRESVASHLQVEMPNGDYAINNNISSVEAVNNNTSSVEMLNGNFALGSASSIGAALPDLEMGTSAAPTQMLNGGGAGGVLPVQAQSTANQEAVDGQLNINSDEFWEFGDF